MRLIATVLGVVFATYSPIEAAAQPARIDFENSTSTQDLPLVFPNVDGLTVTITGAELRVIDLLEFAGNPEFTGRALISWSWERGDTGGISISFSRPVTSVTLRAGDFSGDDDGPLALRAYDCAGRLIVEDSLPWPDGRSAPFATLAVQAGELCRVVYSSGGQYPNSTFIDDIVVTAVPE
jgi:hypothetical protein